MTVDQPIELKIFIVITKWVNELFCHFEQAHIKEKLKNSVHWNVKINVQWYSSTPIIIKVSFTMITKMMALIALISLDNRQKCGFMPHGGFVWCHIYLLSTNHGEDKEHISS